MAESTRRAGPDRSTGIRRLLARAGQLPEWIDRRLAPISAGLLSATEGLRGRARPSLLEDHIHYSLVAGARRGQGRVAASVAGGELRLLQHTRQRVIGWGSVPLPEDAIRAGAIVDAAGLGSTLGETFGRLHLPRRHVSGAISGLRISASLLEVPWVKEEELADVITDEANRSLGVTPEDSYLFWQRLPGRRRERFVYVVAVPREPLLLALEAYEAAGLSLDALDLKPLALARAVNQRDAIVVNLESDSLDVVVVVDDLPVLLRTVALTNGLAAEAQDLVVEEVSRALVGYEGAAVSQQIDVNAPIYISGSAGDSPSLAERLRARTGHPIGRVVAPLHYPSDFPLAEQLVNVGLALKGA